MNIINFFEQVYKEGHKISWSKKKDVLTSTLVVVVAVFIASLFFLGIDFSVYKFVNYLLTVGV